MNTIRPTVKILSAEDGPEAADAIVNRKRLDIFSCGLSCKTSLCHECDNEAEIVEASPFPRLGTMLTGQGDSGDVTDRFHNPKPGDRNPVYEMPVYSEGSSAWKDNNPKDAFGVLKASVTSYLYLPVLMEQAVGMAAGGFKYGAHNYLVVPPRSSVYTDAAIRHIVAFVGGEDFDPEAGPGVVVHHLTAAMDSLHVLRAAQIGGGPAGDGVGGWVDDRPPGMPAGFMTRLNASMAALAKNVPEPVARYFAGGKRGPGRIL